ISHAEVADVFFVLASLNPEGGSKSTVAFLVDRSLPGIAVERIPMRTMKRGSICKVDFHDVRVPEDHRVLNEGEGLKVSSANLDIGRYSVAAQALGQAQASLDTAVAWAKARSQFGQPIGKFQMIQQKLADMVMNVEAARMLVYRVGQLKDAGAERVSMEAAIAKCYASEAATRAAMDAIQILGARGLSEEFAVSRIPLEAKVLEIAEGSNQIQRMLIAEYALGFRKQ
ncbi:MAG TPA: acyl-CoA dehydrogenase, partial [Burkholderiales bacterium]